MEKESFISVSLDVWKHHPNTDIHAGEQWVGDYYDNFNFDSVDELKEAFAGLRERVSAKAPNNTPYRIVARLHYYDNKDKRDGTEVSCYYNLDRKYNAAVTHCYKRNPEFCEAILSVCGCRRLPDIEPETVLSPEGTVFDFDKRNELDEVLQEMFEEEQEN